MTSPHSRPAALFDIDGTLVDSNYLHVHAWAMAMQDLDQPVDSWRIHRAIGMDSKKLLAELLGPRAEEMGERAEERHTKHYRQYSDKLRPFVGARELLRELESRGWQVVLATSAPPDELELLLAALDVEDAIAHVTSADDVETAKPEPDVIHVALQKAGVPATQAVMVGDAVWDGEAARRAGVRFLGVRSGGTGEAELQGAGALHIYDGTAELLEQVGNSIFDRRS